MGIPTGSWKVIWSSWRDEALGPKSVNPLRSARLHVAFQHLQVGVSPPMGGYVASEYTGSDPNGTSDVVLGGKISRST